MCGSGPRFDRVRSGWQRPAHRQSPAISDGWVDAPASRRQPWAGLEFMTFLYQLFIAQPALRAGDRNLAGSRANDFSADWHRDRWRYAWDRVWHVSGGGNRSNDALRLTMSADSSTFTELRLWRV